MFALTTALLFVVAADPKDAKKDPALEAKLAAITKQLASKKQADIIASLEAAGKLGKDGAPLIRPVCEAGVFSKDDEVAAAGADAVKAIAGEAVYEAVLKIRGWQKDVFAGLVIKEVAKLSEDGAPLVWLVHKNMSILASKYQYDREPPEGLATGFKVLRDLRDTSETHWQLVQQCRLSPKPPTFLRDGPWRESYDLFIKSDKTKRLGHVREIIARQSIYWTNDDMVTIATIGADANGALPKLRIISKLDENKTRRDAALAAIEKIEAAVKDEKK